MGAKYGELVGSTIGRGLGYVFGGKEKQKNQDWQTTGKTLGGYFGKMSGFKTGGLVRKTGVALVHKNEFVLPKGVAPTKAQRLKVKKIKSKAKK
jgi:hypothetical protein